ncbi:MAG: hypothetical protein KBC98_02530 [Candidatus Pacebacteria bacterium]|nr:hypothetical protein [Candidatus Paceibacterota bacterium]
MENQINTDQNDQNHAFRQFLAEATPKETAWVEKRLAKLARKARKQEKKQGFCKL